MVEGSRVVAVTTDTELGGAGAIRFNQLQRLIVAAALEKMPQLRIGRSWQPMLDQFDLF